MTGEETIQAVMDAAAIKRATMKLEAELPSMLQMQQSLAKVRRSQYLALRKEGFTEEQTLFLMTH